MDVETSGAAPPSNYKGRSPGAKNLVRKGDFVTRTIVFLAPQMPALELAQRLTGRSRSEIVRDAVDQYLANLGR